MGINREIFQGFIVSFPFFVPPHCPEWFCHLLEHFLVGNFSPLQIPSIFCVRPHWFPPVLVWLMGKRRGVRASERNARNTNNFINKTTKLFFNICSHLQGANKQTNKQKNPPGRHGQCLRPQPTHSNGRFGDGPFPLANAVPCEIWH